LLLVVATYGGWIAITLAYSRWPLALVAPIGALLLTFHGSLQHEIVHGHPTRWPEVNRLMAMVPLSLWLPFVRYRRSHLQHHRDGLTDPFDDPESYYTPEELAQFSAPTRALLLVNQTLAGRMIVGPVWTIGRFFRHEWRSLRQNESNVRRVWLEHFLWCVPVVLWLKFVCGVPLWVLCADDDPAGHGDRDPILRRTSRAPGCAAHRVESAGHSVRCSCSAICTRYHEAPASQVSLQRAIAGFASAWSPKRRARL
jgi:fatty acid desaturase